MSESIQYRKLSDRPTYMVVVDGIDQGTVWRSRTYRGRLLWFNGVTSLGYGARKDAAKWLLNSVGRKLASAGPKMYNALKVVQLNVVVRDAITAVDPKCMEQINNAIDMAERKESDDGETTV